MINANFRLNSNRKDRATYRPRFFKSRSNLNSQRGLTLVELLMVVIIIGLMSGLAATKLDPIILWKQKEDVRKFAHTWEFLYHHAISRGETFRLVMNLDENSYYVLREVRKRENAVEVKDVDYLSNLRTRREKERRKAEEEEMLSAREELAFDESRRTGDLSTQFYEMAFSDPYGNIQLAKPEELKDLAKPHSFTDGLSFRDIKVEDNELDTGKTFIRLSPRGSSQFAVVHLSIDDVDFTIMMNPSTGKVSVEEGYEDFEWSYGKGKK